MTDRNRRTSPAAWLTLLCAVMFAGPAGAEPRDFKIPAGDAAEALRSFSTQSGLQMLFEYRAVKGHATKEVQGQLEPQAALKMLLRDSGLTFEFVNDRTIAVLKPGEQLSSAAAAVSGAVSAGTEINLAQAAQNPVSQEEGGKEAEGPSSTDKSAAAAAPFEEVVVTGSHIRGQTPVGASSVVLDRDYIEHSGVGNTEDLLLQLTQAAPSVNSNFEPATATGTGNYAGGSGVDIRGLGMGTTLVLVNGRRQPAAGTLGRFTDVSNIPLAAIERVEVLLDGASAIYGSDAIGGVVNIVLKKSYRGAETRLRCSSFNGDATDCQASQLLGISWTGGSLMAGYQYEHRQALEATSRDFAADSDQRAHGGDNFSSTNSNPGNILTSTRQPAYGIPAGQDGTDLTVGDLGPINFENTNARTDLRPESKMHSAFATVQQNVTEALSVELGGRYTERPIDKPVALLGAPLRVPSTNPFYVNPFATSFVYVGYNLAPDIDASVKGMAKTYQADGRAGLDLPGDWQMRLDLSASRQTLEYRQKTVNFAALNAALADSNPATAFNPFGDGSNTPAATLAAITTVRREASAAHAYEYSLTADGELMQLPGGVARMAVGVGLRREDIDSGYSLDLRSGLLEREVKSAYTEINVPLIGSGNALPWVNGLMLSVAGRWERYSDFGETLDPRVGLSWSVTPALQLRASWGTSFRAPALTQADPVVFNQTYYLLDNFNDPQAPSGTADVLTLSGVSPDLKEETATTQTVGFDYRPATLPGFSLSGTYTRIEYRNRIEVPGTPGLEREILTQENLWGDVIQRNPSAEQINAICSSPQFLNLPEDCAAFPPTAIIDFRLRNLAFTLMDAVDLNVAQTFDWNGSRFELGLAGTYTFKNERALTDDAARADILDTFGNPLSLRLRAHARWQRGPWDLRGVVNHMPGYDHPASGLSGTDRTIGSWTTLDLSLSYEPQGRAFEGVRVIAGLINVFNTDPPFANSVYGYDPGNANADGRTASVQLVKSW